jgi:hypothetical protein
MNKTQTQQEPLTDLFNDYCNYLEYGLVPQNGFHKLVVEELFAKGITLQELKDFQNRRAARLEAKAERALECCCGLLCYDLTELITHLEGLATRDGHGLMGKGGKSRA